MRGWNKIYEYDIYLSRYKKHGLHLEKNTESRNECNYLTVSNSQIVSENYSDILLVSLFAVPPFTRVFWCLTWVPEPRRVVPEVAVVPLPGRALGVDSV